MSSSTRSPYTYSPYRARAHAQVHAGIPTTIEGSSDDANPAAVLTRIFNELCEDFARQRRGHDLLILCVGIVIGILLYSLAHDIFIHPRGCKLSPDPSDLYLEEGTCENTLSKECTRDGRALCVLGEKKQLPEAEAERPSSCRKAIMGSKKLSFRLMMMMFARATTQREEEQRVGLLEDVSEKV